MKGIGHLLYCLTADSNAATCDTVQAFLFAVTDCRFAVMVAGWIARWKTSEWRSGWYGRRAVRSVTDAVAAGADDVRMFVGGAVGDALRRRFVRRNWLVPRRVMCILFWTGVLLIFIGMILLVTSQHKGRYVSAKCWLHNKPGAAGHAGTVSK